MFRFTFRFVLNFSYSILHRVGEVINQMPDKEQLKNLYQTPFQRTPLWKLKTRSKTQSRHFRLKESTKQKGPAHSEQKTFNHFH
jgi:hypothetical protein